MIQKLRTVFVLGGPGSGKGAQCTLIHKAFGFNHLSAGELLRQEQIREGSEFGSTIDRVIRQGKIVPSHITISLLRKAMETHRQYPYFLIDGFPRNMQNYDSWHNQMSELAQCPFVLHFKCSQEQMIRRLLKRSQSSGRSDDNMQVIGKRLKTYYSQTMQVLRAFEQKTVVHHIDSDPSKQEIFDKVKPIFQNYLKSQSQQPL